ncbi:MAG: hypothetical protein JST39_09615, partial [Bacteroidetes bacterium]|nr:hypothetical protein [Bacteroidota bacterium]
MQTIRHQAKSIITLGVFLLVTLALTAQTDTSRKAAAATDGFLRYSSKVKAMSEVVVSAAKPVLVMKT